MSLAEGGISVDLAPSTELLSAIRTGKRIYEASAEFQVFEGRGGLFFKNGFDIVRSRVARTHNGLKLEASCSDMRAIGFVPNVSATFARNFTSAAKSADDVGFWQYPAATEKRAFYNHCNLPGCANVDIVTRQLHTYVPLPWATYLDKGKMPDNVLACVRTLIGKYRSLASEGNFGLRVHTCCQHIHWQKMLTVAEGLGITDLHIAHKNSASDQVLRDKKCNIAFHAWPLVAVNFESPGLSKGLMVKDVSERALLACFIGAHMAHYLDDSRLRLLDAARQSGRGDVTVELQSEWHFSKIVYQEQVRNRSLTATELREIEERTHRYNHVLSDSKFSLCPVGAGPNTLRLWESCAVGSIPVLFSDDLSALFELPFSDALRENVIIWHQEIDRSLFQFLATIPEDEVRARGRNLVEMYPKIANHTCFNGQRS